jgi:hypothetical protein
MMNHATQILTSTESRATLALYPAPLTVPNIARWRINGYPAMIIVWTAEEWERLTDRPDDAQYYSCGIWCALRMM